MIERKIRRRKKAKYAKEPLLMLIGILMALLLVAFFVAAAIGRDDAPQSTDSSKESQTDVGLTLQQPQKQEFVTLEKQLTFAGTSDPSQSLTIAGAEVEREADGSFSHTVTLSSGENEIVVVHKEQTVHYAVEYRYCVASFAYADGGQFNSGATLELSVLAREGSHVFAGFRNTEFMLQKAEGQMENNATEGFALYTATCRLPSDNNQNVDLGQITYTAICDGVTESYKSGNIICLKRPEILSSDPAVTPDYGNYIDVGSGYIAEIVSYTAETFYGDTRDDYSDPRNNYLPEGTVDYAASNVVYDTAGKTQYRLLRCGYRVYVEHKSYPPVTVNPVVKCYRGTLPDHNEVGVSDLQVSGNHTVLILDTLWKAPFFLDLEPQAYSNTDRRDYTIAALTAEYVDITFCYATKFTGKVEIPADNPLFSKAVLTQNQSDCVLRLYLKQKGGFYGWDSYYNSDNQLCFQFLNPAKAAVGNNAYGADLTGIQVMLDVGHGGLDGGTSTTDANGKTAKEADCNLALAKVLKKELECMGAAVIMNRTDDSSLSVDDRIVFLKEKAPDLCIAIHQNAYKQQASVSGCEIMYFSPQSARAAQEMYKQVLNSGVYQKTQLKWNTYYVARISTCPVVLAECGYMTNPQDLAGMLDAAVVQQKAEDIARGVANYFLKMK